MAEHPILMSGPMVRAILEGRKRMTRRLVKPQPDKTVLSYYPGGLVAARIECPETGLEIGYGFEDDDRRWKCPHGKPGDVLWVRENFRFGRSANHRDFGAALYADGTAKEHPNNTPDCIDFCREWKSVPSIHMPRWASRLSLTITEIRVERLQDISEADAIAEGLYKPRRSDGGVGTGWVGLPGKVGLRPIKAFQHIWQSLNTKPGTTWADNPWVWVVSFDRHST